MNKDSKWIYHPQWEPAPCDARYGNPSPCFRNEFSVSAPVAKAILRVTALGVCKVKINGEFVDSDRFVPGWTDYRQRIYYEEYDVTGMIRAENCIFAVLGDGWYAGMLGLYFKRNFYGDTPMLRAELEVQTKDGQTLSVMTGPAGSALSARSAATIFSTARSGMRASGRKAAIFTGLTTAHGARRPFPKRTSRSRRRLPASGFASRKSCNPSKRKSRAAACAWISGRILPACCASPCAAPAAAKS